MLAWIRRGWFAVNRPNVGETRHVLWRRHIRSCDPKRDIEYRAWGAASEMGIVFKQI